MPAALAIIKVLGHSKSDSLEAKGNHLTNVYAKNAAFMGSIDQTSFMKTTSPDDDLRELTKEIQQLGLERKNQVENLKAVGIMMKRNSASD